MNVILIQEVPHLGNPGDVVQVKPGFARNFLLPRKLAVRETAESNRILDKQREEFAKIVAARKAENDALIAKIAEVKDLKINARTGEDGKLFGTVTSQAVADALSEKVGTPVDKRLLTLKGHIKVLGNYTARIQLGKDHRADFSFDVVAG